MKIMNITDPKNFFNTLDKCKGDVYLVTSEGDSLNLKSKLCQYIALSDLFTEAKIENIELRLTESDDLNLLMDYLIKG